MSASAALNDVVLEISLDGYLETTVTLTSIASPRIWFEGRFEGRFSTGAGFYNARRGGNGWMWLLEDEPDFCQPTRP